ncbi:MAG: hypothetical protein JXR19_01390 [Bacteroidia bacterium]
MRKLLYKLLRYEYWPWWALFIPLIPMYLYSIVVTRKLLYFTAVNPAIDMGGFFGERKNEIMELIPETYKPKEKLIRAGDANASENLNDFTLPVFLKPNIGERGFEVVEINTVDQFENYQNKGFDFVIQEKLNEKLEFGLSYHRLNGRGKISSLVHKEFMTVIGDGERTVYDLVNNNPRHRLYMNIVEKEHAENLHKVPPKGEKHIVHMIGNHSKGTRFVNMDHLINESLTASIDKLASKIEGFDYGRFDFKVESIEALEQGHIKIFELNGVSAEPGTMYDQNNVFQTFGLLYRHWNYIALIAKQNIKKGVKTTPLTKFIYQIYNHFFT